LFFWNKKFIFAKKYRVMEQFKRIPNVKLSYILELKYLKTDASEAEAKKQWDESVALILQYAQGRVVNKMVSSTQLHLIVVQMRGFELNRMEEVLYGDNKDN